MCMKHSHENITLISNVHKMATNYKKVCSVCYEKGCQENVIPTSFESDYNITENTNLTQNTLFPSPIGVDQIVDNVSVTSSVTQSLDNTTNNSVELEKEIKLRTSQINELNETHSIVDTQNKLLIKQLEGKVVSQAKELQSIALMVEKKIKSMQTELTSRNSQINELQLQNSNYEADIANKQQEITEVSRQLTAVLKESADYSRELSMARETTILLENNLYLKTEEWREAVYAVQRMRIELETIKSELQSLLSFGSSKVSECTTSVLK